MSEIRYMISDAARQVGVEAHVLRSWEEELDIKVGRTELGHRYYTDKTIYIMKKVKELRDKGFSSHFYAHIWAGPKVLHPLMSKLMWI